MLRHPVAVATYLLDSVMGVSWTRGTPKSSTVMGFSIINHLGVPHLWKPPKKEFKPLEFRVFHSLLSSVTPIHPRLADLGKSTNITFFITRPRCHGGASFFVQVASCKYDLFYFPRSSRLATNKTGFPTKKKGMCIIKASRIFWFVLIGTWVLFSIQLGMSLSQLTFLYFLPWLLGITINPNWLSYFSEGRLNHQAGFWCLLEPFLALRT